MNKTFPLQFVSVILELWEVGTTYRTPKIPMENGSTTTIQPAR